MSEAAGPAAEAKKGIPGWVKAIVAIAILAAVLFAVKKLDLAPKLQAMLDSIRELGAVGVVAYFGLYIVATLIGVATPLTMAAGVIYGVVGGVAIVSPASVVAATIAFLLGRFVLRSSIEKKVAANPKFAAIERAVGKNGFKIVGLVRLSPVFPFTLLNYGLGLTPVKLRDYVLASWLGMLPGTLLYVYLGYTIGDIGAIFAGAAKDAAPSPDATFFQLHGQKVLLAVGLVATIAVTTYVTKIARGALREELEKDDRSTLEPHSFTSTQPSPEVQRTGRPLDMSTKPAASSAGKALAHSAMPASASSTPSGPGCSLWRR